jgi:predicted acyltransferase
LTPGRIGVRSAGNAAKVTVLSTGALRRQTPPAQAPPKRVVALDVVRGVAIVGMLLVNNSGDPSATPTELAHSPWHGLTVADLVFPLFLFAVGVAMPMSKTTGSLRQVLRRCALLFVIGSLLVSAKHRHLGPSTGVLQHIAGAYLLCWALLRLPRRWQPLVALGTLGVVWAAYELVGSYGDTTSIAARVDTAVLGGFAPEGPHNLPTSMVSVFLGVVAGRIFTRYGDEERRMLRLLVLGGALMAAGAALAWSGVPVNKALWTPSYVLVTSGIAVGALAVAYQLVDRFGHLRAARPLVVMGANAIAVYIVTSLAAAALHPRRADVVEPLKEALRPDVASVAYGVAFVLVSWALCEWLYRRRTFLRL